MSSNNTPFIITIAGISGKLGRSIVQHILGKPNVVIHGLTRDPASAPDVIRSDPRITLYRNATPTDVESLRPALKGSQIVICTYLGAPDFEKSSQIALIDACIAEGVPRFMTSDFTVDWRKVRHEEIPQKGANRAVNTYLHAKETEGKINGVRVLLGAFMESLFSYGYFWFNLGEHGGIKYWGTGDETWEVISYDTTGKYVAEIATDEQATGWFEFLGDRKTTKEILQLLREIYGNDIVVPLTRLGSFDELEKNFQDAYARAPNDHGLDVWKRTAYLVNLTSGKTYLKQPLDNQRYPNVHAETLEEWLKKHEIENLIKTAFF